MSPENQATLIKFVGIAVQVAAIIACVKLLPGNPEILATVTALIGTATGALGWNSPLGAVRAAKGLVSVRAPSDKDAEKMRAAIAKVDSVKPPAGDPS